MATALPNNRTTQTRRSVIEEGSDVPTLLREIRARTGLTQEKFAARLGVTFPTINRWENGRAWPSPLALQQIWSLVREMEGDAGPLAVRLTDALQH
jgi:DNA-binding transcriptional regulator YiaG